MRILIQLRPSPDLVAAVADPGRTATTADVADGLPGVELDPAFVPVAVPRPIPAAGGDPLSLNQPLDFSLAAEDASVLVRGTISDDELTARVALLPALRPDVVGVFADPVIESAPVCGGDPPAGDWHDVERLLNVPGMQAEGLDGDGVTLAVLDTGINAAHAARQLGRGVTVDAQRCWSPSGVTGRPGEFEVDHGTMCAFDALIAAPQATLIDIPLLLSTRPGGSAMDGLLSDAVAAFAHLRTVLDAQPAASRALVVTNSWGSFSPEWDFPVGHPGNYSDNAAHPFNLMVAALDKAGADVLFAAGNCGRDCPDGRCAYQGRPIVGANSHPRALSVGGVDVNGERVGYSSQGPGRLTARKPDVCAYTHFLGSKAFGAREPDSGTSAAAPVAAGLVAAVRSRWPASELSPAQLRALLRRTAEDRSEVGFDYDYGYGTVDPAGIIAALQKRSKHTP
ncbi:bacillopeptidase F [[Actinomadura] parvosata subsp. kistnae]|uniref:Peptidase S8 n=2 Tax=Nonomuraea TaxID=83681 RepID=A0A1V0A2K1_9ACTN|nr:MULTISPECIES: S8 family serine peptidase [unclassified Nonomuraea]AQZ64440.1 peptidase S8 [Nonomuraea sp. ATCC 55076]NJP88185.1 S8 family peptidase [Nonomuraea sp. FMUSA5-5]SPL89237.1 bacillopeptidase F [Actinomadura parvosata subsp. kistnae]